MINAVFAWVISNLFITFPASVIPVFIQIPLAIWIGFAVYKRQKKMLVPSLFALAIMYITAIISSRVDFLQIDIVKYLGGEGAAGWFRPSSVRPAFFIRLIILMSYVYIASSLPVWKLLQPRDFISSPQLGVGLL